MADPTLAQVAAEADRAAAKYGPFASVHEAIGVLVEEWDELRAAVHANDLEAIHREALQVAAVAYRLAAQTADPSAAFSRRSTGT